MNKVISITGLDCAACASELEEELEKIEGVKEVSVSFLSQRVNLKAEGDFSLTQVLDAINNFEEVKVLSVQEEGEDERAKEVNGSEEEKKITLKIRGLDCAACASELEEELEKIEGVKEVSVSFVNQTITLTHFSEIALSRVKETANHFEEVKVVEIEEGKGKIFRLQNLHCAACAAALQEQIEKIDGVNEVIVDFVSQKMTLDATEEGVKKAIRAANHFEKVKVVTERAEEESSKKELIFIILSGAFLLLGSLFQHFLAEKHLAFQIATYAFYAASYLLVGYPVLISTAKNIVKGRIFDENFLMTVASIGAVCLGEYREAAMVMFLYQIGEYLQALAVGSSRKSIVSLMDLKSESATLLKGGESFTVKPEELKVGDFILVKAGEKIPVDGVIAKGESYLDAKSLTGESMPFFVRVGDEALSGCINEQGVLQMRVTREYSDSAVKRILDLVENASSKKSKNEKFITKFAKYYTPVVCIFAFALAAFVPLILGLAQGGGYGELYRQWIHTALIFLVISCPCALIISVPLTYFGGIGRAAKSGILVKGATYLDSLSRVSAIAFDKTGTLTKGEFSIVKVNAKDEEKLLSVAAALEKNSSHPLAKPFLTVQTPFKAENAEEIAGKGIAAQIGGKRALAGNAALLRGERISFEEVSSPSTVIYVSLAGEYLGSVEIDDAVKANAKSVMDDLRSIGVKKLVMLTGDKRTRAELVGKELSLDEVKAELLPEDKISAAKALKEGANAAEKDGKLMVVGDGVNDAPVLALSDVAVSMGQIGSSAAIEASDVVLLSDSLESIPTAIRVGKRTRKIVIENIVFSIAMKVLFLLLGVFVPSFPLWAAVFGDVGVMLLAVLNSLRIRGRVK